MKIKLCLFGCGVLLAYPDGLVEAATLRLDYSEQRLYTSRNLAGHVVAAECNPGGGSSCPCAEVDVRIASFDGYGAVTSNARAAPTWVNAIGHRKFVETFASSQPIALRTFRYSGKVRLPVLPRPDANQRENPQAVHLMVQLWDGRNALWPAGKQTLEGALYWDLNPWGADFGKVKVYSYPLTLSDTGLRQTPDTNWHSFTLVVDLAARKYVALAVDDQIADLGALGLAQVAHPEWGGEVALSLTTESLAAWPQTDCARVFTWTTQFKDLAFSAVEQRLSWIMDEPSTYAVQYSTDLRNWRDLGAAAFGSGPVERRRGLFWSGDRVFYRVAFNR